MKIRTIEELVDYLHGPKPSEVKKYIIESVVRHENSNKGFFWEDVLEKAMSNHTTRLHRNAVGRDFADDTDAKFATFRKQNNGSIEASISGIRTKRGFLRVCLCVPGIDFHRVMFMLIPHHAYQKYKPGSDALKVKLSSTGNIYGNMYQYTCSFDEVCAPVDSMMTHDSFNKV